MRSIAFRVYGLPGPQGSKAFKGMSHAGHAILLESSKKVKPWRTAVSFAARDAIDQREPWAPLDGPLTVTMFFYLPRPKSAPKHVLYPTKYPDLSKLIRSTEDAMTDASVWADDARVRLYKETGKLFATENEPIGAFIYVEEEGSLI
jgi:Holliday junction resolvase RusA-like endonuclease